MSLTHSGLCQRAGLPIARSVCHPVSPALTTARKPCHSRAGARCQTPPACMKSNAVARSTSARQETSSQGLVAFFILSAALQDPAAVHRARGTVSAKKKTWSQGDWGRKTTRDSTSLSCYCADVPLLTRAPCSPLVRDPTRAANTATTRTPQRDWARSMASLASCSVGPHAQLDTCMAGRQRRDSSPCGQSPMDFESISLTARTQCHGHSHWHITHTQTTHIHTHTHAPPCIAT